MSLIMQRMSHFCMNSTHMHYAIYSVNRPLECVFCGNGIALLMDNADHQPITDKNFSVLNIYDCLCTVMVTLYPTWLVVISVNISAH